MQLLKIGNKIIKKNGKILCGYSTPPAPVWPNVFYDYGPIYNPQTYRITRPSNYPVETMFVPKINAVHGERIYLYLNAAWPGAVAWPGGVQFSVGMFKGDYDASTSTWSNVKAYARLCNWTRTGTDWATPGRIQTSLAQAPVSNFYTDLVTVGAYWDDSYDGLWISYLHDPYDNYTNAPTVCHGVPRRAFVTTSSTVGQFTFDSTENSGTYVDVVPEYTDFYLTRTGSYYGEYNFSDPVPHDYAPYWGTESNLQ